MLARGHGRRGGLGGGAQRAGSDHLRHRRGVVEERQVAGAERHVLGPGQQRARARRLAAVEQQAVVLPQATVNGTSRSYSGAAADSLEGAQHGRNEGADHASCSADRPSLDGHARGQPNSCQKSDAAPGARARQRFAPPAARPSGVRATAPATSGRSAARRASRSRPGRSRMAERTARRRASSSAMLAAHRVAGDVRALEAELGEQPLERVRVGGDRRAACRRPAAASCRSRGSRRRPSRTRPQQLR